MKKISILVLLALVFAFTSCRKAPETNEVEQLKTEENQERLMEAQPPVRLQWSLEREQVNKRTELWNKPNKVSYIYLINYGKIMAFYSIKGKVSSVNSQVTNPEQIARVYKKAVGTGYNTYSGVLPSPAEDGSYGTNGDAIFFFTTDGAYIEWKGDYMLCDKPYKLAAPPDVVRYIDAYNGK
jgi:hypothetical protein